MAGLEILSPEGLRLDGRRPHELRKIVCRMGVFKQADGSAYIEMGNTKALATVYGPHEVTNKSKILHDRVLLNCQFSMATFSTGERKKRPKGDRRSTETSMLIRRTFEAAILTQLYPRSQIDIYVQVISIVLVVFTLHPRHSRPTIFPAIFKLINPKWGGVDLYDTDTGVTEPVVALAKLIARLNGTILMDFYTPLQCTS